MAQRRRERTRDRRRPPRRPQIPHREYDASEKLDRYMLRAELMDLIPEPQWSGNQTPQEHVRVIGAGRVPLTEEQAIYVCQLTAQEIKRAPGAICNKYVKRAISNAWAFCNQTGGGTPAVWQMNGKPINGHGTSMPHSAMLARLAGDPAWMLFDVAFAKSPDLDTWAVEITPGDLGLYIIDRL